MTNNEAFAEWCEKYKESIEILEVDDDALLRSLLHNCFLSGVGQGLEAMHRGIEKQINEMGWKE